MQAFMKKPDIQTQLEDRILVLDGAMGTMIQGYGLQEVDFRTEAFNGIKKSLRGNNDLLSITRPDVIREIHEAYLQAGADIIETNTFSGTTIAQEDYECESFVDQINLVSAQIARQAADKFTALDSSKPRYVAGSIGPTNKTASISPDVNDPGFRSITFDQLKVAFKQQMKGLQEGGVDLFLIETVLDTLNAKAALMAAFELRDETGIELPVMLSGTITDASGRTLSGQTTEAFLISIAHFPLLSVGINCALGAKNMLPYVKELSRKSNFYISAHPNAGLPNEMGEEVEFEINFVFIDSVLWNFGDPASGANNTDTAIAPTHVFSDTGFYTVTLIAQNGVKTDTVIKNIYVKAPPEIDLGPDQDLCSTGNDTVVFSAGLPNNIWREGTYNWSNGSNDSTLVLTNTDITTSPTEIRL
jgi:5-methyltetrahydrofolate--homocysteine methyltransferase